MKVPNKVNVFRRRVMKGLTKNIGQSYSAPKIDTNSKIEIKKVLISRPNHRLGNQLLSTPLVQEITNTFPDCKIDLFVRAFYSIYHKERRTIHHKYMPRKIHN